MTWPTHALLGICTLWVIVPLPPEWLAYHIGMLAACAAFGAMLPDLDASESKIKHLRLLGTQIKPFLLAAQVIHRSDQHRGLLHSLAGLGMVGLLGLPCSFWLGWAPVAALLLGYASHLLADSATKSGIRLWYPKPTRFYLLPKGWRVITGSQAEEVLFVALSGCALLLLLRCIS